MADMDIDALINVGLDRRSVDKFHRDLDKEVKNLQAKIIAHPDAKSTRMAVASIASQFRATGLTPHQSAVRSVGDFARTKQGKKLVAHAEGIIRAEDKLNVLRKKEERRIAREERLKQREESILQRSLSRIGTVRTPLETAQAGILSYQENKRAKAEADFLQEQENRKKIQEKKKEREESIALKEQDIKDKISFGVDKSLQILLKSGLKSKKISPWDMRNMQALRSQILSRTKLGEEPNDKEKEFIKSFDKVSKGNENLLNGISGLTKSMAGFGMVIGAAVGVYNLATKQADMIGSIGAVSNYSYAEQEFFRRLEIPNAEQVLSGLASFPDRVRQNLVSEQEWQAIGMFGQRYYAARMNKKSPRKIREALLEDLREGETKTGYTRQFMAQQLGPEAQAIVRSMAIPEYEVDRIYKETRLKGPSIQAKALGDWKTRDTVRGIGLSLDAIISNMFNRGRVAGNALSTLEYTNASFKEKIKMGQAVEDAFPFYPTEQNPGIASSGTVNLTMIVDEAAAEIIRNGGSFTKSWYRTETLDNTQ